MTKFNSIEEIINFAIDNEIRAQKFYTKLLTKAYDKKVITELQNFIAEEKRHEMELRKLLETTENSILDISDKITEDNLFRETIKNNNSQTHDDSISLKDALIIAGKREQQAFMIYIKLAEFTPEGEMKDLFLKLAYEEAKHKLHFELAYEELRLKED